MSRGLSAVQQMKLVPVVELIRAALPHLVTQSADLLPESVERHIQAAIRTARWDDARADLEKCQRELEDRRLLAVAEQPDSQADMLLMNTLLLKAKTHLCSFLKEWEMDHFGSALTSLRRARIEISAVAQNSTWLTVQKWEAILDQCEDAFPAPLGVSPEMMVTTCNCSICKRDISLCDHVPNRIYRGTLCQMEPQGVRFDGLALVRSPDFPEAGIERVGREKEGDIGVFWPDDSSPSERGQHAAA